MMYYWSYILGVLTTAIVSLQLVLLVLLDPISGKHYCVEYIYDLKRENLVVNWTMCYRTSFGCWQRILSCKVAELVKDVTCVGVIGRLGKWWGWVNWSGMKPRGAEWQWRSCAKLFADMARRCLRILKRYSDSNTLSNFSLTYRGVRCRLFTTNCPRCLDALERHQLSRPTEQKFPGTWKYGNEEAKFATGFTP